MRSAKQMTPYGGGTLSVTVDRSSGSRQSRSPAYSSTTQMMMHESLKITRRTQALNSGKTKTTSSSEYQHTKQASS